MPVISPFRATHFDLAKVGDLSKVVTQPYDRIDAKLQQAYYDRHPRNIVRVILGKRSDSDTDDENVYTRSASHFREWLKAEVLVRRPRPAIYPYHQTYAWIDGRKVTRRGFVSMLTLEDFSSGKVRPHEHTLAGPKADRLSLLRATHSHFGQIFMIYADPERRVNAILEPFTQEAPFLTAVDDDQQLHQVWEVADESAIRQVADAVRNLEVFIADGHHRYETALSFRNECRQKGLRPAGSESFEGVMATMVNLSDEGLNIFPTHRVVHSLPGFDPKRLLQEISGQLSAEPAPDLETLQRRMREARKEHAFGLAMAGDPTLYLLRLKGGVDLDAEIREARSAAWKRLDVSILHALILEKRLGIDAEALAKEKNLHYVRHAKDAVAMTRSGASSAPAAFLLNPTRVEEVEEVAKAGDRMPQKSTDFYPKLLTGLLMCRLEMSGG